LDHFKMTTFYGHLLFGCLILCCSTLNQSLGYDGEDVPCVEPPNCKNITHNLCDILKDQCPVTCGQCTTTKAPVTSTKAPVTTSKAPATTTTEKVETTTKRTYDCSQGSGKHPSPYDCAEFYVCFGGVAHIFHCPGNLWYDPKLKVCNWPSEVDCHISF